MKKKTKKIALILTAMLCMWLANDVGTAGYSRTDTEPGGE